MPPLGMESPASSEASTGYLQDAVAGWSDRCKRRRTVSSPNDPSAMVAAEGLQDLLQQCFWDSDCHTDPMGSFSCMIQDHGSISDDPWSSFMPLNWSSRTQEEAAVPVQELLSSPSHSHGRDTHESRASPPSSTHRSLPLKESGNERMERRRKKKVVYPFAVVKPGGMEGDVTLADINERILMRPTRPVRHPVGEFACGPWVTADGPGLSGKAVVGLTRIHTQGRGTITIIRTRG